MPGRRERRPWGNIPAEAIRLRVSWQEFHGGAGFFKNWAIKDTKTIILEVITYPNTLLPIILYLAMEGDRQAEDFGKDRFTQP
jgi:hypothetical protein